MDVPEITEVVAVPPAPAGRPSRAKTDKVHRCASAEERQIRLDYACELLLTCKYTSQQISQFCAKFPMHWRNASRYLSAARKRILESTRKPRDEWMAESILIYDTISKDPLVKVADRLTARKQLDRALGIGVGGLIVHAQQVHVGASDEQGIAALVDQVRAWEPPAESGEAPPGVVVVHAEVGDDHAGG